MLQALRLSARYAIYVYPIWSSTSSHRRDKQKNIGYSTQKKVRGLLEQLYAYAIKYDIVSNNYAIYLDMAPHIKNIQKALYRPSA